MQTLNNTISLKNSDYTLRGMEVHRNQAPPDPLILLQGRNREQPTVESYDYSHLPSRSLRLLRFISSGPSEDVECELATFPLSQPPRYNALSYCWGDSTRTSPFYCNGKEMMITPALKGAINRLCTLDRGNVEWIWIDQICINQLDAQERSSQVNMMKDIYQTSEGTIIWLGPDIPGLDATTDLMERMSLLHDKDVDNDCSRKRRPYTIQEFRELGLPTAEDPFWKPFGELLSRQWFVRAWIIQEVVLSQNTPRMLCGSHDLVWEKLLASATWLILLCYTLVPQFIDQKAWAALRSLILFKYLELMSLPWDLTTLLNKALRFRASEPRDKVYSLFGLAGEMEDSSSVPMFIRANYDKPVRDVFRDVTRYLIESSTNLSVLNLLLHVPDWQEYPSWVINFASDVHWERISYFNWGRHVKGWQCVKETVNNASGGTPIDLGLPSSDDILTLKGLRIDVVKAPFEVMALSQLHPYESQILIAWKKACEEPKNRYVTTDALAYVFMVTLVANWSLTGEEMAINQPMSHFWAYMRELYNKLYEAVWQCFTAVG